jgi:hypothetical protein
MTSQVSSTPPSGYGSAADWATIIRGAGEGGSSMLQGASAYATSKKEAKESKRRTIANLLNNALRRSYSMNQIGQEYSDEMADFRNQQLQQLARGFVDSLQGSTGRM